MNQYIDLLEEVLETGHKVEDRTGTGTLAVFGHQMRFNLQAGFPLLTTKKLHVRSIIHELLWMLSGDTNIKYLNDNGVHIWDEWADKHGELGPVYGKQWRSWDAGTQYIDQIKALIHNLQRNPGSRRHLVTAWNPGEVDRMALPPCHCLFQFHVQDLTFDERLRYSPPALFDNTEGRWTPEEWSLGNDGHVGSHLDLHKVPRRGLSCQLYQRSADIFLGVPFNIASYALLTMMVAQVCGYTPLEFIWTGGDCHLYLNHIEQAKLQLGREPRLIPKMIINPEVRDIFKFTYEDFTLEGYDPHPHIKAEVSV